MHEKNVFKRGNCCNFVNFNFKKLKEMLSQHFIIVIFIYLFYRCDRLHGHSEIKVMWHNKDTSEYYDIYSP